MTTLARSKSKWTPLSVAAMVLGFIVWWPIGLAVIAYIVWGGSIDELVAEGIEKVKSFGAPRTSSGNAAFDAYRAETLRRLEEEQREFAEYVGRLREARDREEFDRFMAERQASKPDVEAN